MSLILYIGQVSAAEVTVIPSTLLVTPGETFTINISIDPMGTAIAGAQLNIAYDQSLISVNSIEEGDIFKNAGVGTFFSSGIINNSAGTVTNIFNAITGNKSVTAGGTFITINATATGSSGTSAIELSTVKISKPNGDLVSLNVTDGSVRLNSPPVLTAIGDKTVDEGQILSFMLAATDIDNDPLTFSALDLPSGASFNAATRTFQWTPDHTQSGNYSVRFNVTDGIYTDEENIIIIVRNVNRAPTFTSTPANNSSFNETDVIQITVTANDPDNDPISYRITVDSVQVSTSSNYNWTTNYSSAGYHNIIISVSDGINTVNSTITIYINNVYPRYDVNNDGTVDVGDLVLIGQHFNEIVSPPYPRYDVNMDGIVDILDITMTAQRFGENT
jgi:hypothetical protein